MNVVLGQTLGELAAHAPHFFHRQLREQLFFLDVSECVEIKNTLRARMFFGYMVGQLGKGFGRTNAHTHWNARPLHHTLAHAVTHFTQIGRAREIDKAFVDGIHLGARGILAQNLHHPIGQVGIQSVVAAERKDAVFFHQVFALKPRLPHAHTQGLGLVRARHHAAIVVGQHYHGHVAQVGPEESFATHIEVVAIDQSQLLHRLLSLRSHARAPLSTTCASCK